MTQYTTWSAAQIQVVKDLRYIVEKWNFVRTVEVPLLLHVAVCLQESSLDVNAVGDNGRSYGIFQINQDAHPYTDQLATSGYADYGYHVVRDRWELAFVQLGGPQRWPNVAQRGAFIEEFAPLAQGSVAWPQGLGSQRYAEAVNILEVAS